MTAPALNVNLVIGSSKRAFHLRGKPQLELVRLLQVHTERFHRLLQRPVIVSAHWQEGAAEATFSIMPVRGDDPDKKFETLTVPFPPGPQLVSDPIIGGRA